MNSSTFNNLGTAFAAAGKLEEAIPNYLRAAQLNPDYVEAWFNLGRSYGQLGRWEEAIAPLQTVVSLRPGMTAARDALEYAKRAHQGGR
jgi:superkiller protein 3